MISGSGSWGSHPIQAPGAPSRPASQNLPHLPNQGRPQDEPEPRSHGAGTQCVLDGVPPAGGKGCFRSPSLIKINKSNSRGHFVNYTDGPCVTHKLAPQTYSQAQRLIFSINKWLNGLVNEWHEFGWFTAFVCQIRRNTLFFSVRMYWWLSAGPPCCSIWSILQSQCTHRRITTHTIQVCKGAWKQAAVSLRQRNKKRSRGVRNKIWWTRLDTHLAVWEDLDILV